LWAPCSTARASRHRLPIEAPAPALSVRVIFVNRYFAPDLSATSQMLTDLAQRLLALGRPIHVVCSRQLYDEPRARLPDFEIIGGVQVHRVWTARFGRGWLPGRALDYLSFYFTATLRLLMLLQRGDLVIVMTDPPMMSVPGAVAARLSGARRINWLQDVFPEVAVRLGALRAPRWLRSWLQSISNASLGKADCNVVIGARMAGFLRAQGVPVQRICIIENWADGRQIKPQATEHSALRHSSGLAGRFVVGYSGNLGRAHEYEGMIGAAEALRDDPQVAFLVTGGGKGMEELRLAARERGLASFTFAAYMPRAALSDALAAADVHLISLLPELEGLIVPSKLYGIMAAGRPAIFLGDSLGEVAVTLREAGCGFTVPARDGAALAARIRQLQQDRNLCMAMGRQAREKFETCFGLDQAAARWQGLIEAVVPVPRALSLATRATNLD
jgi:colanic acid biosynthesis glycosyl transferase WcaI